MNAQPDMRATPHSTSPLIGLTVRLQRTVDRPCECGDTSVTIGEPAGPHIAALFCTNCRKHRGSLPKQAASFGDNQPAPDESIQCEIPFLSAWVGTSLKPSSVSGGGLHWLCKYLAEAKLLETQPKTPSAWQMRLTMHGWEKFTELKRQGAATSQAFVAMWFDNSTHEAWENGLQKGIAAAGYEPLRIDAKEHVNKICDEIIAEIRRSRFVVADYTGHRGACTTKQVMLVDWV